VFSYFLGCFDVFSVLEFVHIQHQDELDICIGELLGCGLFVVDYFKSRVSVFLESGCNCDSAGNFSRVGLVDFGEEVCTKAILTTHFIVDTELGSRRLIGPRHGHFD